MSAPAAITISAGIIVISRRMKTETCQFMKPSTIICPASVPTVDDESPEARSAIPNAAGASEPRSGPSVRVGVLDPGDVGPDVEEHRRGHDHHRGVDEERAVHGECDVDQLPAEVLALALAVEDVLRCWTSPECR